MKFVIKDLTEIPESLRPEYEQREGVFVLKIDGETPGFVKSSDYNEVNKKLTEYRDNNRALHSQLEEFKVKYNGFDPEEHKKLRHRITELEAQGLKGDQDVSTLIQKAIAGAVEPLKKELADITEREKSAKAALARRELESVLTQEGLNAGISEKAIPDFIRRGLEVWRWEDGKAIARDGNAPLYSKKNVTEPLTPVEWIASLSAEAPHLFKPSSGGGATNGPGGGNPRSTYNPNDEQDFLKNIERIAKGEMVPLE